MTVEDLKTSSMHIENTSTEEFEYSEDDAQRGALLLEEERRMSVLASARMHWRALLICSVSFTAGMAFGYDTVVNGASISMPAFFLYFGAIGPKGPYLPSLWTSLWTAMSSLTQALGAFFVGFIMDKYGRKWPASISGLITIAGTCMQYYSHSRGLLLGGKMVTGLGIGAASAAATSYASEVAPIKLRALVLQSLVIFIIFMQGLALGIVRIFVPNVAPQAFRNVFAIQWIVGSILTLAFALTPESPIYLITHNRLSSASKVLSRIYGPSNPTHITYRLAHLTKTIRDEQILSQQSKQGTYLDCFKPADLKRTLTGIFLYTSPNLGGAAFLAQSIYFLIIAGLPAVHTFDVSIGGFGLAIVIILCTWSIPKRLLDRRSALLAGLTLNFLIMLIIGCLYFAPGLSPLWAIAVLMNVLISIQTSLMQAMGWPIAAELSSYRLRGKTLSILVITQTFTTWLTTFVVPYIYNVDAGDLGAKTGFIFAATSLLLLLGAWFLVPETEGLKVEEIDRLYADKVKPRCFKKEGRRQGSQEQELSREEAGEVEKV